ncbi:DEAD/DEAH box helicase [Desulfurococcus mucosus]|uniref:DEAD/DEAH box helicase n=1 Tax=Desulfurococcus mucosus TaxID=2275 RepID=UPI000AB61E06|nr:DEAD/DEAH box helicase [Desulfurococcus mucosus]
MADYNDIDVLKLKDVYHAIIKREAEIIAGGGQSNAPEKLPCLFEAGNENTGPVDIIQSQPCKIVNYQYCLDHKELIKIAGNATKESEDNASTYINELEKRGFLIRVEDSSDCFRSYHMDVLIRASGLKSAPQLREMVISSSFALTDYLYEGPERHIIDCTDTNSPGCELYSLLSQRLGSQYADAFVKIVERYFETIAPRGTGSRGLTLFQLRAIKEAIKHEKSFTIILSAPTGSGKTEIFLLLALYILLSAIKNGDARAKVVLVYPRKFLEVDQMMRIVELARVANEVLGDAVIKVAIRDGDTTKIEEKIKTLRQVGEKVEFRGIKCMAVEGGRLYVEKIENKRHACFCIGENGKKVYNFVQVTRRESKSANIVVTNLETLFYRVIDSNENDIDINDILDADLLVFDEAHEYDQVKLAVLHYTLKLLALLREKPPFRVIYSSATLGNAERFARDMSHVSDDDPLVLTHEKLLRGAPLSNRKLVVNAFVCVNPYYSWETYLATLAATLGFISYALDLAGRGPKQTVIFVNSVREIGRLESVIKNELSLGTPLDIACMKGLCPQDLTPSSERSLIKHYADLLPKDEVRRITGKDRVNIYDELSPRIKKVYGMTPLDERTTISEELKEGKLYVVLATSSLELGVDYPAVNVVVNAGFDKPASMIQRVGRAARDLEKTLNVALSIVVVRNSPIDWMNYLSKDPHSSKNLLVKGGSSRLMAIPVAKDVDQVMVLSLMRSLLTLMAYEKKESALGRTKVREFLDKTKEMIADYSDFLSRIFPGSLIEKVKEKIENVASYSIKAYEMYNRIESLEELLTDIADDLSRLSQYVRDNNAILRIEESTISKIKQYRDRLQGIVESLEENKKLIETIAGGEQKLNRILEGLKDTLESCNDGLDEIENETKKRRKIVSRKSMGGGAYDAVQAKKFNEVIEMIQQVSHKIMKAEDLVSDLISLSSEPGGERS